MHNLTYIATHFMQWSIQGYTNILGLGIFWVMMFLGITGYIYLKNQSVVGWAIAMLIIFTAFGDALVGINALGTLLHILIALSLTALLLLFVSKYRK